MMKHKRGLRGFTELVGRREATARIRFKRARRILELEHPQLRISGATPTKIQARGSSLHREREIELECGITEAGAFSGIASKFSRTSISTIPTSSAR